ncbi:MAG: hypothetical protein IT244_01885 [Bacteroidia bacterium]|nr:hypothetical protein [Bacteroidia bacterium]
MKVSYNKEKNTYTLHEISEFQMELIGISLMNENKRILMLGQLTDEQFKEILLTDAEFLNNAAKEKAINVEALKEELNDPKQLQELRSKSGFGKSNTGMQKLCKEYIEGQQQLLKNINFDINF